MAAARSPSASPASAGDAAPMDARPVRVRVHHRGESLLIALEPAGAGWRLCVEVPEAGAPPGPGAAGPMSRREREIMELVATGLTDAQIARRLWISRRTVTTHLHNVYRKLEVGSRTAALHALGIVPAADTHFDGWSCELSRD